MPKLVRRGRAFWTRLVEEFERGGGGEAHEEFASRHGVLCDTFRRWLYLLRAERGGRRWQAGQRRLSPPAADTPWPLVEVQTGPALDARFEVDLVGGRRLRIPVGFDADVLRRLLAILDERAAT